MRSTKAPNGSATISSAPSDLGYRLRRLWRATREVVLPVAVLLVLGIVWEIAVRSLDVPIYLLPAPSTIWKQSAIIADQWPRHTGATMQTVMIGFAISVVLSFPIAVLITSSQNVANVIYPLLVLTNTIPKIALAPLLVIALGTGQLPGIAVTVLVAFFPLVISIAAGLLSTPQDLLDLGRFYRATKFKELAQIRLPYAVPFTFSGLKVAISLSVLGAVVGEFVAGDRGLGFLIVQSTAFFNTPVAFAAIGILSILGIGLFQLVVILERIFFPWSVRESFPGA